ncbi:MAG TPA: metalloregulator ArsR/SmtB family transcription factor [Rhizomicrobium sp.]|jgi:ArsR family transcriptional regulator, arsenate/arsenite/antimonite-responsive transcriptional repressor
MEIYNAVKRLSALAQDGRLSVIRALVKAGPNGMAAGEIARSLEVPGNTLSAQLLVLANAQLVRARRDGRSIIYSADFDTMRDLLVFLTEDCCAGSPEQCAPLTDIALSCNQRKGTLHETTPRSRRSR